MTASADPPGSSVSPPDPQELRTLGTRAIEWLTGYVSDVADRPVFPDVDPAAPEGSVDGPLPPGPRLTVSSSVPV